MKKLAIIGAGAASLVGAIFAARRGIVVEIFEQNDKIGKKILVSGNGRCNITNTAITNEDFYSLNSHFVNDTLNDFSYKQFKEFALSIGLLLDEKEDGRVYPLSNEAKSFVLALESEALRLGITIYTSTPILHVKKSANSFILKSEEKSFKSDYLLIATGSLAAEHLGANDSGMKIAQSFKHSIVKPYPALVGLHLSSHFHQRLSGLKIDALLSLHVDNTHIKTIEGDLLFTKYGVSGFGVLDISTEASFALLKRKKVALHVNFLPRFSHEKLTSTLFDLKKSIPEATVLQLLNALISIKLAKALLKALHVEEEKAVSTLSKKDIIALSGAINKTILHVNETHGFKHAEVSGGGINSDEINPKTMESKRVKNLYFAGEVIDVVGKRGGYNFHFAYASAYSVAQSISR